MTTQSAPSMFQSSMVVKEKEKGEGGSDGVEGDDYKKS